jgi:hypothetical protein
MPSLFAWTLLASTLFSLCTARIPSRNLNETTLLNHCGCLECDESIWSRPAADLMTGETYSCGDRITYYMTAMAYSEQDACSAVAGAEFPTVCGRQCNPSRCDGRYSPPAPSFSNGTEPVNTVTPDTPIYCFPEPRARKQWNNVFGKYKVQAKEDTVPCGPGNNFFSSSLVSVRRNRRRVRLQFRKLNGTWTGSEIRIPACEQPFSYGHYLFSVKSITVHKASTGALVAKQLPISLVLGLFTWDTTDDFVSSLFFIPLENISETKIVCNSLHLTQAIHPFSSFVQATNENYNHETDIEISQWNIPGNEDVQFLVQPPKAPQLKRFFSGGDDGSIDHGSSHTYSFDWAPNRVDWHTTAAGGYNHSYSTADAHYYGTPDYVQCLPADLEIRMNLWNMLGTSTPTGMADDDVAEVVIDNFTYLPSKQERLREGEACSKSCQCGNGNACIYGFCYPPQQVQSQEDVVAQINTDSL